jgi:hypothetical protein
MDENEHITYIVNENLENDELKNFDVDGLLSEFDSMSCPYQEDIVFAQLNDYDLNYTLKQLTTICDYYEINTKKMKKNQVINMLVSFENNPENTIVVIKRRQMWHFVESLKQDKFMKKFVIW